MCTRIPQIGIISGFRCNFAELVQTIMNNLHFVIPHFYKWEDDLVSPEYKNAETQSEDF
jgi:hypothetical protein